MTDSYTQQCTRFSKINHAYFFLDAVRRKDYLNICRHFLWQLNRQNNQPLTQKSIVSTIAALTEYGGVDSRIIANVLTDMKKSGEIERFKGIHNRIGWNPDITNQVRWSRFKSSYAGKKTIPLSEAEESCYAKILELSKANSYIPHDLQDFEHTMRDDDMKQLIKKVEKLEEQNSEMMQLLRSIAKGMNPDEAKEKAECHLKLIEGGRQ